MAVAELRAQQQALLVDAHNVRNEITDSLPAERVAELDTRFDTIMAAHDAIDARIAREERLETAQTSAESRAAAMRPRGDNAAAAGTGAGTPTAEEAFRSYIVNGRDMPAEHRAVLTANRAGWAQEGRAQSVGTTTAGGYTVPQGFLPELVRSMLAWGPMLDPSLVREIVTATGNNIEIPTSNDTGNVGVRLAENTIQSAEGDVVFGQKVLDAYKYSSGPILVSQELLQDSAFDIQAMLFDMMAERLARKLNLDMTTGDGTGDPNGIVTASTLGKTAAGVAAVTADELIDLYHSVDPAYRASPTCRFMFKDATLANIRKLKDAENRYLIDGLRDGAGMINLAGIVTPYSINQAMPAMTTGLKSIIFGDFKKYVVRRVRDIAVKRSDDFAFTTDQATFSGFARYDGELLDTAAVKHLIQA